MIKLNIFITETKYIFFNNSEKYIWELPNKRMGLIPFKHEIFYDKNTLEKYINKKNKIMDMICKKEKIELEFFTPMDCSRVELQLYFQFFDADNKKIKKITGANYIDFCLNEIETGCILTASERNISLSTIETSHVIKNIFLNRADTNNIEEKIYELKDNQNIVIFDPNNFLAEYYYLGRLIKTQFLN